MPSSAIVLLLCCAFQDWAWCGEEHKMHAAGQVAVAQEHAQEPTRVGLGSERRGEGERARGAVAGLA